MNFRLLFSFGAYLFFFIIFLFSCSKDDSPSTPYDPEGTVSLNMLSDGSGRTLLANSDVYITYANNFYGKSSIISSLGKKSGLADISELLLIGGTSTAAVEIGKAYQIFEGSKIKEFPSGKLAYPALSTYYNVYVVSNILEGANIIGANVKFLLKTIPDEKLSSLPVKLGTINHLDASTYSFEVEFPTSDFEYELAFSNYTKKYQIEKEGNKLTFRLLSFDYSQDLDFYVRINNTYKYFFVAVR